MPRPQEAAHYSGAYVITLSQVYEQSDWDRHFYSCFLEPMQGIWRWILARKKYDYYLKVDPDTWVRGAYSPTLTSPGFPSYILGKKDIVWCEVPSCGKCSRRRSPRRPQSSESARRTGASARIC